jgi:hypothetical protein
VTAVTDRRPELMPQLVSDLGGGRLLLSASKELERGARAAMFLAPRLFRFDVISEGDTLRTVVRNLSRGALEIDTRHHNEPGTNLVEGGASVYEPAKASVGFTLRTATEEIQAEITIGILSLAERGTVRVTAQASLRQQLRREA